MGLKSLNPSLPYPVLWCGVKISPHPYPPPLWGGINPRGTKQRRADQARGGKIPIPKLRALLQPLRPCKNCPLPRTCAHATVYSTLKLVAYGKPCKFDFRKSQEDNYLPKKANHEIRNMHIWVLNSSSLLEPNAL